MEIVWPSAIGEARKWENTFLRLPPKLGSDSSVRSNAWPSANGRSEQRKKNTRHLQYPKIGPDSSIRSIVRPSAVGGTKEDQHLCGGFRRSVRIGTIRLNRPSAWRIRGPKRAKDNEIKWDKIKKSEFENQNESRTNIGTSEPYNNAIQPAEPRLSCLSLTRKPRQFPQSLSLRAKAFGLVRRLIGRYTD